MDNYFTVEHRTYGIGSALLVKHRRKEKDDLFMCSFKSLKGKTFYCRKHIDDSEDIWWSDGKTRKTDRRRSRTSEIEEQVKSFFSGGQPINS